MALVSISNYVVCNKRAPHWQSANEFLWRRRPRAMHAVQIVDLGFLNKHRSRSGPRLPHDWGESFITELERKAAGKKQSQKSRQIGLRNINRQSPWSFRTSHQQQSFSFLFPLLNYGHNSTEKASHTQGAEKTKYVPFLRQKKTASKERPSSMTPATTWAGEHLSGLHSTHTLGVNPEMRRTGDRTLLARTFFSQD